MRVDLIVVGVGSGLGWAFRTVLATATGRIAPTGLWRHGPRAALIAAGLALTVHGATGAPAPMAPRPAAAIDLNQATRAEIEAVRAVGVELTERLLRARSTSPFSDWQDLRKRVKGVSRRALEGFAEAGFHIRGKGPSD
ncbi:MAG: hypothetical protein EBT24_04770 [Betaproteobacteria bacterium]|nr:hypothetical protein [Betaproteobacteria bacterium]